MNSLKLLMLAAALLVAQGADAASEKHARRLALAQAHAGEPVRSIHIARTQSWESLGDEDLLLWTSPGRAYLLKLDSGCHDLGSAMDIELKYQSPMLSAGFDHIRVLERGPGVRQECRILEIRPVDVKAMKAADKEARKASQGK